MRECIKGRHGIPRAEHLHPRPNQLRLWPFSLCLEQARDAGCDSPLRPKVTFRIFHILPLVPDLRRAVFGLADLSESIEIFDKHKFNVYYSLCNFFSVFIVFFVWAFLSLVGT